MSEVKEFLNEQLRDADISKLENGTRNPSLKLLKRLVAIRRVS